MKWQTLCVALAYLTTLVYCVDYYDENPYVSSDDSGSSSGSCEAGQVSSRDEESCCSKPEDKDHTKFNCVPDNPTCWVICDEGYSFPGQDAATKLIECKDGTWMDGKHKFQGRLCQKNSQNPKSGNKLANEGSTVVFPGENGRKKRDTCDTLPKVNKAVVTCSWINQDTEWSCTATCSDKHLFRNGASNVTFSYRNGGWKPKASDKPFEFLDSCFAECQGKKVSPEETIGPIQFNNSLGWNCINTGPVKDMVVCEGQCHSSETYTIDEFGPKGASSNCMCCRPMEYEEERQHQYRYLVEFTCDVLTRPVQGHVQVPTACYCGPCSSSMAVPPRFPYYNRDDEVKPKIAIELEVYA